MKIRKRKSCKTLQDMKPTNLINLKKENRHLKMRKSMIKSNAYTILTSGTKKEYKIQYLTKTFSRLNNRSTNIN